jgi:hypothetical protein
LRYTILNLPTKAIVLWKYGDGWMIDGFGPDGVSARVPDVTRNVVKIQTGYLYHYAFAILIGVAGLITWFMFGLGPVMTTWPTAGVRRGPGLFACAWTQLDTSFVLTGRLYATASREFRCRCNRRPLQHR